jgi:hypothetical protein
MVLGDYLPSVCLRSLRLAIHLPLSSQYISNGV